MRYFSRGDYNWQFEAMPVVYGSRKTAQNAEKIVTFQDRKKAGGKNKVTPPPAGFFLNGEENNSIFKQGYTK